ncbi:MAG TPA: glycosyltransferase family 2 protein [Acidimicrobiales bacterium]|nr:glycosyltransferase family 2 protein [Acidimicrobiales bacterium]
MHAEPEAPAYRRLSVLVPVYNERATVGEILRRMRRVELPGGLDLEIVVVDDGSTDGTDKVLSAMEDSTVMVLRHQANQGKGACIRTALARAHGDLVLIQDADLEYDPEDWPTLLAPVLKGRAQVVYGSRFLGAHQTSPYWAHLGNRLVSIAADVIYNTNLSDVQTCYKLFARSVLDGITIESDRFDFEPEVTAKLLRGGVRIYEVPISFAGRAQDEGRKFAARDTARALTALVRYRFRPPDRRS